jgi:death-on-curing protein
MIEYLGRDDILFLIRLTLKRHGGAYGIIKPDILEYAVDAPKMSSFGQELYPSLHEKAAVLGFTLIAGHAFEDGNKRVGYAAMQAFLEENGYMLHVSDEEAIEFILKVANRPTELKNEFFNWVRVNLVQL